MSGSVGPRPQCLKRLDIDEHGRLFDDCQLLKIIAERTKRPVVFVERSTYLQALYDNIEDKFRVRDHVGLVSFSEDDEGVTVFTTTGEEIRGSILVGADGIHSTVRGLMAGSVAKSDPQRAVTLNEGTLCDVGLSIALHIYKWSALTITVGFRSYYRTIFGTARNQRRDDPSAPLIPEGASHTRYYRGVSGVAAVGVSGLIFFFLFVKEDKPSTTPNCPRYSEEDAENTMRQYGHLGMGPDYTFNDLWELRIKATMVPLEEGTVEGSWNTGGRAVLLGDSVSKV